MDVGRRTCIRLGMRLTGRRSPVVQDRFRGPDQQLVWGFVEGRQATQGQADLNWPELAALATRYGSRAGSVG